MWFFALVIVVLAALFCIEMVRRQVRKQREQAMTARIRGDGRYAAEVVGESHYGDNFRRLRQEMRPKGADEEWFGDALLRLEGDNPHDDQAVAVFIDGRQVGYLGRDLARDFRFSIQRGGLTARSEFAVGARIYWGGDDGLFSVSLDLPMQ